jgi:hypothetical protein
LGFAPQTHPPAHQKLRVPRSRLIADTNRAVVFHRALPAPRASRKRTDWPPTEWLLECWFKAGFGARLGRPLRLQRLPVASRAMKHGAVSSTDQGGGKRWSGRKSAGAASDSPENAPARFPSTSPTLDQGSKSARNPVDRHIFERRLMATTIPSTADLYRTSRDVGVVPGADILDRRE